MKGLREKFRNNKGFTLIEMLIVVAIIAILIAVSIPLVSTALERAREATDASNERAFKAELTICYLDKEHLGGTGADVSSVCFYDAVNGTILADKGTTSTAYGQGTSGGGGKDANSHEGMFLWGFVDTDAKVHMMWSASKPTNTDAIKNDTTGLTGEKLYVTTAP